ncbi:MAG TPA: hypothetical protein V6D29_07825 [Leptolyngbyaceae cyanobacterium]
MISQLYYLLRSRLDGSYLAARPRQADADPDKAPPAGFLLVFSADYDALSYLNAHAPDLADKFSVETVAASQLKPVLSRWGFQGVGMVSEPRQPQVEFFKQ